MHSKLAQMNVERFPITAASGDTSKFSCDTKDYVLLQCPTNISQNFALFHCIGPSIQTALFNAPLVVIVGWALGKDMDLNFEIFMIVLLVLSIVVVGNFLRDGESNYLEGSLLVVSIVRNVKNHTNDHKDRVHHRRCRVLVLP